MEKVCPRPLLFIQAMTYNKKYAFFGGVEIQMALYANIIIDISHEKLDRPFIKQDTQLSSLYRFSLCSMKLLKVLNYITSYL